MTLSFATNAFPGRLSIALFPKEVGDLTLYGSLVLLFTRWDTHSNHVSFPALQDTVEREFVAGDLLISSVSASNPVGHIRYVPSSRLDHVAAGRIYQFFGIRPSDFQCIPAFGVYPLA